jgi:Uma2 family endonuclease
LCTGAASVLVAHVPATEADVRRLVWTAQDGTEKMCHMSVLPRDHPWTVADLELLPDDGLRYELVDGTLLVSAAPSKQHQRVLGNLYLLLHAACPGELEVFLAPIDYQPTSTRSLQPDLLVVRRDDPGPKAVTTALALAVEVLSPSSRSVDLVLKRELYEQAGVHCYWVVDPDELTLRAWVLQEGRLVEQPALLDGTGDLPAPFPIRFVASDLVR